MLSWTQATTLLLKYCKCELYSQVVFEIMLKADNSFQGDFTTYMIIYMHVFSGQKNTRLFWWYLSYWIRFWKIFKDEMLSWTQATTLLLKYCKCELYSQVVFEIMLKADNSFQGDFTTYMIIYMHVFSGQKNTRLFWWYFSYWIRFWKIFKDEMLSWTQAMTLL